MPAHIKTVTMYQPIISNSYLVEINLGTLAAQKQVNIGYIPQLEGSKIISIQTFTASDLATSPNGQAVTATLAGLTGTFVVGDDQDIYLYPLSDLRAPNVGGFQRMFNNKVLNLTKSFVTIQSTAGIVANDSVLFLFHYIRK